MCRAHLPAVLLAAALALGGCGASKQDSAPNLAATLLLDFQPNAIHSGIYTAVNRGYDDALGVTLRVRAPSDSTDAVKLLVSAAPTWRSSTSTISRSRASVAATSSA